MEEDQCDYKNLCIFRIMCIKKNSYVVITNKERFVQAIKLFSLKTPTQIHNYLDFEAGSIGCSMSL